MTNHPNRNWRKRWTVDLTTHTATHETGLVVRLCQTATDAWDADVISGRITNRLLNEAADIYLETKRAKH